MYLNGGDWYNGRTYKDTFKITYIINNNSYGIVLRNVVIDTSISENSVSNNTYDGIYIPHTISLQQLKHLRHKRDVKNSLS